MNTLPLQQWVIAFRWEHNGNLTDKKISKQEATRANLNGAIIRIGRDQASCNLHIEDSSVSGQHAEIYFNEQQQKFFIKSLQPKNITKVDGQDLVYGSELPLKENSIIVLGQQKIEVNNIQIYQVQGTNYSGIASSNSSPNSAPVNSNPNSVVNPNPNSIPVNLNVNLSNVDPSKPDSNKKHWWQEPTVQAAIIAGIVGLATIGVTSYNEKFKTEETLKVEREKTQLQTSSTEKLDYIKRLQEHKQKVLELLKKDKKGNQVYSRLKLISDCDKPISMAVSYLAPNDIEQTKGWFNITNERPIYPSFYTLKSFINIHAYIQDNRDTELYNALKQSPSHSRPWKQEDIDKYLEAKSELNEKTNYRNKQWQGNDGLVERNIISPSDFDYIENPLFFNRDEEDIIDKVEFYQFKFDKAPSGTFYTEAKFSCKKDNLTLEIQK